MPRRPPVADASPTDFAAAAARTLVGLIVLTVTVKALRLYPRYLPPDFTSDFLAGRASYFFGAYRWAFYPHLMCGPLSLVLGLFLMSPAARRAWPRWHRRAGRVQAAVILTGVAPAGFWMALRAEGGPVARAGFATLAVLTAATFCLGWRAAVKRDFGRHEAWMRRCMTLLCSAVVIRVVGGAQAYFQFAPAWSYTASSWASWAVPLLAVEGAVKLASLAGDDAPSRPPLA